MEKSERMKYVNRGYMNYLSSEPEILKALSDKYKDLAKKTPNSKWVAIFEGFELGAQERSQERKQELSKIKEKGKGKGKSKGRSR